MLAQPKSSTLSLHDQQMLHLVLGEFTVTPKTRIDVQLPPDQNVHDRSTVEKLVSIEKQAIQLQKSGQVNDAYEMIDQLVISQPKYASGYNNRAQLRRLLNPDDICPRGTLSDLESAIALALPPKKGGIVSKMQATVLRNAYGQLAAIYLQQSKQPENKLHSWRLQMKASDMMVEASNYGEQIAATLAANINPYSKLCGNMMETVLQQFR